MDDQSRQYNSEQIIEQQVLFTPQRQQQQQQHQQRQEEQEQPC